MISVHRFNHYLNLLNHPDCRQRVDALQDIFFMLLGGCRLHPNQWELLIPILVSSLPNDTDATSRRWKYQVGSFSINNNKMLIDHCINNFGKEPDAENRTWIAAILAKNLSKRKFRNILSETNHRLTDENIELATYLFNDRPAIDTASVFRRSDPLSMMWLASIGAYKRIAERNRKEIPIASRDLARLIKETNDDEVLKHVMYAFYLQDSFRFKELLISPDTYTQMGNQQKKWFFTLIWRDQHFVRSNIDYIRELTSEKHLFHDINPEVRIGLARGLANSRYLSDISPNILDWYSHENVPSVTYYLMGYFQNNQIYSDDFKAIVNFQREYGTETLRELVFIHSTETTIQKKERTQMTPKEKKLFISHSHEDVPYVRSLANFLDGLHIPYKQIFCSSVPEFGIPLGYDIYDYLKEQFVEYDLHILFILSDHYYQSAACLNEMGAAWVLQKKSTAILLPGFKFSMMEGAINPRRIGLKLDGDLLTTKVQLGQLRDILCSEFDLPPIPDVRWEQKRDEFINNIHNLQQIEEINSFYHMGTNGTPTLQDQETALLNLWQIYSRDHSPVAKERIEEMSKSLGLKNMCITAQGWANKAKTMQDWDVNRQELFRKASTYFECVLMTDPKEPTALREYGGLYYDFHRWDDALNMWEKLTSVVESDYHYWLCANVCQSTEKIHMLPVYCQRGLMCPDTGYHKELNALTPPSLPIQPV